MDVAINGINDKCWLMREGERCPRNHRWLRPCPLALPLIRHGPRALRSPPPPLESQPMASWSSLTSPAAFKSPAFIALVTLLCVAVLLLLHHCVLVACCCRGGGAERRRRRQHHHRRGGAEGEEDGDEEEAGVSVEVSATTSRTHLVVQASAAASSPAVVCRYRKEEAWKEPTCAVCLADFDDGEPVRVLPECLHYFHADCIGTWLRGSTSCPMCRAEITPTPSPTSLHHHHHRLELSVSLEEILVHT